MSTEFLKYLTPEDQQRLEARAERESYGTDDLILREGEERQALFLIRAGTVRVEREHLDFRFEISRLGPGEIFGEMGFVEGFVASANVVANEALEVDIIASEHVDQITREDDGFSGRFYKSLAEILSQRLRETTVRGASEYSWGGTDPALGGGHEPYIPSEGDAWGGPDWSSDDDADFLVDLDE